MVPDLPTASNIEKAYQESGNQLGWRFLYSPIPSLEDADVAFLGLNPGGASEDKKNPCFAPRTGSAYETEQWGNYAPGQSPLQQQVRGLFAKIRVEAKDVLSGNLIPFRSASLRSLKNRGYCFEYGAALWSQVLRMSRPGLIIGMGRDVERILVRILDASQQRRVQMNWGKVSGRCWSFPGGTLVVLPHLSRFRVITREASQQGLAELFGQRWIA